MKWEIGLSTGIGYRHPIETVLEAIRGAGFRTIEVATARTHLDLYDGPRLRDIAHRIDAAGLAVRALHAPFGHDVDFTDPDPGFRERSLDMLTRAADALHLFGGSLYVVHPGGEGHDWVWERDVRLGRSVEALAFLWQRCRERGLTLVVETPLPHLLGGQLDDLARLLERIPSEGTGVCVDTSHTSLGSFLLEAIERFGPRLVHVQASDNRGVTDDHLPPGEGVIDWPRVVAKLEEVNYEGVFLLELAGSDSAAQNAAHAAECARRALGVDAR